MKIKSITIEGMHNVAKKLYTFNDITYLVGRNGAGKSTVLEAIQLALLGYIPGYAKTNEGIFRHASSRVMAVKLKLDDSGTEVVIDRSWIGGSSIKADVVITPEGYDISSIVKDIELPIFNFNDFKDMTANKLKEWFINFLPNAEGDIDWDKELRAAREAQPLDSELISNELATLGALSKSFKGVELVKEFNAKLKDHESYLKGQSSIYKNTIDSLIHYDDIEAEGITSQEIQNEIAEAYELKNKYSLRARLEADEAKLVSIVDEVTKRNIELPYVDESAEPALLEEQNNLEARLSEVIDKQHASLNNINDKLIALRTIDKVVSGGDICPYSGVSCDTIKAKVTSAKKDQKKAQAEYDEATAAESALSEEANEIRSKLSDIVQKINDIHKNTDLHAQYNKAIEDANSSLETVRSQIAEAVPEDAAPVETIDALISEKNSILQKVIANEKYNEMMSDVSAKKVVVDDSLELMKAWIKLTGANGLQTKMMDGPFIALTDDMSKNLSAMFGKDVKAKFNLSEKANSFSFGLERDDSYIPFEVLSSGERCLYTLALMLCIMDRCQTKLRLVIIDDLLDHLDGPNMKYTFEALNKISKDTQIILAGVQPCGIKDIEVSVE